MAKKTPGRLNPPSPQAEFDKLPLNDWSRIVTGVFYRIHPLDPSTRKPYGAVYFSKMGCSRFDPVNGLGTVCLAESLAGAIMEKFDDYWGPAGSIGRSLTTQQLSENWVSLIYVPPVLAFEASGVNLSAVGTDAQLFSGEHATARGWALRLMRHPLQIDGIYYISRHDNLRRNLALFARQRFLPEQDDPSLVPARLAAWRGSAYSGPKVVCGAPVLLRDHPELSSSLAELKVAILP